MNRSIWLSMLDAILVGSAFAGLIAIHEHGPIPEQDQFLLMLLVPIAYVLSSSLFARTNLAVAASRAYLLYLCIAIAGTGLITIGLVRELGQVIKLPADQMLDRVQGIVESGAQVIPRLILPIVCGVGLYAFSSVFEKMETGHPHMGLGNAKEVESLVASLRKMNVPEQLSTVLSATVPVHVVAVSNYFDQRRGLFLQLLAEQSGGVFCSVFYSGQHRSYWSRNGVGCCNFTAL